MLENTLKNNKKMNPLKQGFLTEKEAIDFYIQIRYKGILTCPHCGSSTKIYRRKDRPKICQCKNCNNSFSVFKGTIFEKSTTDIRFWFDAAKSLINDKKGMPALLFQRKIASDYDTFMSYKCFWRIFNRIRMAMGNSKTENMFGFIVETDETYVGNKPAKINNSNNKKGRGTNKTPVHGIYDRYLNRVSMNIMLPDENNHKITGQQLIANLDKHCKENTLIISDDFKGYNALEKKSHKCSRHLKVNHSKKQYSAGNGIHTNNIERAWVLLKRGGLFSRYHNINGNYLQYYLNEYLFRFNNTNIKQSFITLLEQALVNKPKVQPFIIKSTMWPSFFIAFDCSFHIAYNGYYNIQNLYKIDKNIVKFKVQDSQGNDIFVLERDIGEGYQIWEFYHDFSVDYALDFLELFDKGEIAA